MCLHLLFSDKMFLSWLWVYLVSFFHVLSLFEDLFVTERWKKIPYLWKSSMCMHAKLLQLCLTLCNAMDGSLPPPLSVGFSMQEYWSGLPVTFSRGSSQFRDRTHATLALVCRFFTKRVTWEEKVVLLSHL